MRQLTFLVTSPRVAPGLMSWPAWQAIASADRVLASADDLPLFRAVTATGHRVDVLPSASAASLLAAAASEALLDGVRRDGHSLWCSCRMRAGGDAVRGWVW